MVNQSRNALNGVAIISWLCSIVWVVIIFPEVYFNIREIIGEQLYNSSFYSKLVLVLSFAILVVAYSEFKMAWVISRYPVVLKQRLAEGIFIVSTFAIGGYFYVWKLDFLEVLLPTVIGLKVIAFVIMRRNFEYYQLIEKNCYQRILEKKPTDEKIKKAQRVIVRLDKLENIWWLFKLVIISYLLVRWIIPPWHSTHLKVAIIVFLSFVLQGYRIMRGYGLTNQYVIQHLSAIVLSTCAYYLVYPSWKLLLLYIIFRCYTWLIVRLNYQGLKYIDAMHYFRKQQEQI